MSKIKVTVEPRHDGKSTSSIQFLAGESTTSFLPSPGFSSRIKALMEKIDVKKKFPGYFNIWIFRVCFYTMYLLAFIQIISNGGHLASYYVECPIYSKSPCENPFYDLSYDFKNAQTNITYLTSYSSTNTVPKDICDQVHCQTKYLMPGESFGHLTFLDRYGIDIFLLLLIAPFIVNHLVYVYRSGNWKYVRPQ